MWYNDYRIKKGENKMKVEVFYSGSVWVEGSDKYAILGDNDWFYAHNKQGERLINSLKKDLSKTLPENIEVNAVWSEDETMLFDA